jgi:hypothetical protein
MPKGIRSVCSIALAIAILGVVTPRVHAQKGPTLDDVMKAATDYLVKYSETLKVVTAETEDLQEDTSGGKLNVTRRITSDVVMLGLDNGLVGSFRDMAISDGHVMNDKRDRMVKILTDTPESGITQLQNVQEGAVHEYLSQNLHILDSPFLVLQFLKPENQSKVTYKLDGVKNQKGVQIATIKFAEKSGAHVIQSPVQSPTQGRFLIELPSGAIHETEIIFVDKSYDMHTTVTYAMNDTLGLWVPSTLDETIGMSEPTGGVSDMGNGTDSARQTLESHIKYSKYGKTAIDVTKIR